MRCLTPSSRLISESLQILRGINLFRYQGTLPTQRYAWTVPRILSEKVAISSLTVSKRAFLLLIWTGRLPRLTRAAEKITGVSRQEALGRPCLEVFSTNVCKTACVLRKAIHAQKSVFNVPVYMIRPDSKRVPIVVNATILKDRGGRRIGGVETFRDLSDLNKLRKSFHKHYLFEDMVSQNQKMLEIFSTLKLIADSDCTVLIEGATGTGKELLAKAVHTNSPQKKRPVCAGQLRRVARRPHRIRAFRLQDRRLYRCQNRQTGGVLSVPRTERFF